MVVTFVRSFPPDPKADAENFQRKQAEYKAAYHHTKEPFVLYEALLNADAYLQLPADLNWLVEAVGECIMKGRADQTARRFWDRMRHVRRYRCVQDLLKAHAWGRALDLAVAKLEATDPADRSTIEKSYIKVKHDLEQKGHKSEYFFLVARSNPTKVPVAVSQTQLGTIINGVLFPTKQQSQEISPTIAPATPSPAVAGVIPSAAITGG